MKLFVFAAVIVLMVVPLRAEASPFRDISPGHFAHDAIIFAKDPANGAFMVGDANGNFNPRRQVSKFDAARIFALALGFRNMHPSLPIEQQELQYRALDIWRPFLSFMSNEYGRWIRAFDSEVAFLLYKGIITKDDVNSFVLRQGQNEVVALLTFNEAHIWTSRIFDLNGNDIESPMENLNRAITRAELAVVLYSVLYTPTQTEALPDVNQLLEQLNRLAGRYLADPIMTHDFVGEAELPTVFISGMLVEIRAGALSGITIQSADGMHWQFYVPSSVRDVLTLNVGMLVSAEVAGIRAVSINVWGNAW